MRILHLSDTHLARAEGPDARGQDGREILRRLLADCEGIPGLDLILVSGDVADDGSVEGCAAARDLVDELARARAVPTVFTMGNHDLRASFAVALGSGHRDASGAERATERFVGTAGECAAVSEVAGVRVISLDSVVPDKAYGWLATDQLDWLREVLREPAPGGSVVALHHPPLLPVAYELHRAIGLQNPGDLGEAVRDTDVRAVLCGHYHSAMSGTLAGVPVWVAPGVADRIDLTAAPDGLRTVRDASANVVDLPADGDTPPMVHVVHARDPRAGEVVVDVGAEEVRKLIAAWGAPAG